VLAILTAVPAAPLYGQTLQTETSNNERVYQRFADAPGAYYVCLEDGPRLKLSRSCRKGCEEAIEVSF
jgi:hypothetical protein